MVQRILVVGCTTLTKRILDELVKVDSVVICGILSSPKEFSISYSDRPIVNLKHVNLHDFAEKNQIPYFETGQGMNISGLLEFVISCECDYLLVAGWHYLIPRNIRQLAPVIGIHASLLPKYAGGAPLVWAMLNGERKTGISIFQITENVDSGPVLGQVSTPIYDSDDIGTLTERVERIGIELLLDLVKNQEFLKITSLNPLENKVQIYPQRSERDANLDVSLNIHLADRFVKSQTRPYHGAFVSHKDKRIRIWKAAPKLDCECREFFHKKSNETHVRFSDGCLNLIEFYLEE